MTTLNSGALRPDAFAPKFDPLAEVGDLSLFASLEGGADHEVSSPNAAPLIQAETSAMEPFLADNPTEEEIGSEALEDALPVHERRHLDALGGEFDFEMTEVREETAAPLVIGILYGGSAHPDPAADQDDTPIALSPDGTSLGEAWAGSSLVSMEMDAAEMEPVATTAAFDTVVAETWENDPLFERQWHLDNPDTGIDINVLEVWKDYDGSGVKIGIWDDGVQYTHPDLDDNYDESLHILLDDGVTVHDPAPENADSRHGTAVAGIIAAEDNDIGVVGVAFGATIAGVDIFEDPALDDTYATNRLSDFDVTNHSWGWVLPYTDARGRFEIIEDFLDGIEASVIDGRDGLGTINVVSAGNNRVFSASGSWGFIFNAPARNTNDSTFTAMPETIAVGAVGYDGIVASYSTPGASLLISAPSQGSLSPADPAIWTTDRTGEDGYSFTDAPREGAVGNTDLDYTGRFNGTSAAAPIVTGVVALVLEANPDLGWRDVQEILASTARHVGSDIGAAPVGDELFSWGVNAANDWNGGGRAFSNDYGFGLIDAHAAVRLAETWISQQTSGNWRVETAATWSGEALIADGDPSGIELSFLVDSDIDLEVVGLDLSMWVNIFPDFSLMPDLEITLISPSGTVSVLATATVTPFVRGQDWQFNSHAFRGEDADGVWTVSIADVRTNGAENTLTAANLVLMGDAPSADDLYVFTNEFSDYANEDLGHSTVIRDRSGGVDTINAAAVTSDTVVDLAAGTGTIDGVSISDLRGIENVFSGDGDDVLTGGNGVNWLRGGRGDDVIAGGNGDDILDGGAGDDELYGGRGRDTIIDGDGMDLMFGGLGADTFILSFDGVLDWIMDFDLRADFLVFEDIQLVHLDWSNDGDGIRFDIDDGSMTDTLYLYTQNGRGLDAADLSGDMFMFA